MIEIGRNLSEVRSFSRLRRQAESSARLINAFQRLLDLRVCNIELLTFLVELLFTRYFGLEQFFGAFEFALSEHLRCLCLLPCSDARPDQRDLIVHVFNRVLEFEAQASGLPNLTAHRGLCHNQISLHGIDRGLLDRDLHAIRFRIELDENVAFFDPIIVIDKDARDLSAHTRRHERDVAIHISVISRNGVPRVKGFRDYDKDDDDRADRRSGQFATGVFSNL